MQTKWSNQQISRNKIPDEASIDFSSEFQDGSRYWPYKPRWLFLLLVVATLPFCTITTIFAIPSTASTPKQIERGPQGFRLIALTFDAGGEDTAFLQLLNELAEAKIHSTFFVTGHWVQTHPGYIRQLAKNGHEIGNHTWSHQDLTRLTDSKIYQEIESTDQLLASILGQPPSRLFRPPYGSSNTRVLMVIKSMGFRTIYWTFDSLDSVDPKKTAQFLFNRITSHEDKELDGAIVLMHVGEPSTVTVLPNLIETLQARGFHFVTISRLLNAR